MIFVLAEQSKAVEATDLIPMLEGHQPSNEFHSRILFKHEKFIGEEEAFSIGGF